MATQITATRLQGLGIHDTRINEHSVTDQGTGSTDSDYTQAGAYPGVPEAQQTTMLALEASGAQADKGQIRVRTSRAGGAGADGGAFLYRDVAAGESASQYQGWDGYQAVTGCEGLYRNAGTGAGGSDVAAIRLNSRNVLTAYAQADGTGDLVADLYKPDSGAWTTRTPVSIDGAAATVTSIGLTELLPEARVLAYVPNGDDRNIIAVYSDDEGATWADASRNVLRTDLPDGVTINEVRAAYSNDQVVLFIQYTDGGTEELAQYASTDRGLRFDLVSETWDISGEDPDTCSVTALRGGGFLLCYSDPSGTPTYNSRRIGSAFEDAQNADSVTIASTPTAGEPTISVWEDEDGIAYALAAVIDGAASWSMRLFRTSDQGDSWDVWGGPVAELNPGAVDTELNEFACTSTGGLGILVTRYTAPSDGESDSAVVVVYLGGHSSHTLPATDESVGSDPLTNFPDNAFICWSQSDDNGKPGALYLPVEEPQNCGWTAAGAGTEAITAAQKLEITTTAAARSFRHNDTDATVTTCTGECDVEIDAGSGDDTTTAISVALRLSDYDGTPASATFTYDVTIRLDDAGWSLYDENGSPTIVGSPVVQATTSGIKIRWAISSTGFIKTWWTTDGPQRKVWTEGPGGSLTNTTADVSNAARFGHYTTGTAVSRWSHFGVCFWGWQWSVQSTGTLGSSWANPDNLHGRHYSPFPVLLHDGVQIAAKDGPSFLEELWDIYPEHTYALSNIHPQSAPSPRRGWRNTAHNVEQRIVWDLDEDFSSALMMGSSLVIMVLNSNLESVEVESWDGAAWQPIVTMTSTDDWDTLTYQRRGANLIPNAGAATVGQRFMWYHAHAGDTVDLGLDADSLHKVKGNTEGSWRSVTSSKKPTIILERDNMPGALASDQTGTMAIRRKDFGAVVHSYNEDDQMLRLKIPAQKTADGDYRIGQVFIGHVAFFGHQYDRGRSVTRVFDADVSQRSGGTKRARKRGPDRRVVEIAWADTAVDSSQAQTSTPEPDYVRGQSTVDIGVATARDTIQLVEGVHMAQDGPVAPVLYLGRVETDANETHALTDWKRWVYGRLETDPRIDNVLGDELQSELNRLNTVQIVEEV